MSTSCSALAVRTNRPRADTPALPSGLPDRSRYCSPAALLSEVGSSDGEEEGGEGDEDEDEDDDKSVDSAVARASNRATAPSSPMSCLGRARPCSLLLFCSTAVDTAFVDVVTAVVLLLVVVVVVVGEVCERSMAAMAAAPSSPSGMDHSAPSLTMVVGASSARPDHEERAEMSIRTKSWSRADVPKREAMKD